MEEVPVTSFIHPAVHSSNPKWFCLIRCLLHIHCSCLTGSHTDTSPHRSLQF